MQYLFIINPRSGPRKKRENLAKKIADHFKATSHIYKIAYTTGPGDANRLAHNAATDHYDIVVAVGGDGTVNEVASGLMHTGTALGIVPMGSGNGVARSLNLPLKLNHCLNVLSHPALDHIDTGDVNGHYFVGISGTGLDARIGYKFQHFGVRGPIPYFVIGAKEFLQYTPQELVLRSEDQEIEISPLLLAIANTTQYGNGALIAPMANPQDGWFDICYLNNTSLPVSLFNLRRLFNGTINKSEIYHHFKAKSLSLRSRVPELYLHLDGEPHVMSGELKVRLHHRALKVALAHKLKAEEV